MLGMIPQNISILERNIERWGHCEEGVNTYNNNAYRDFPCDQHCLSFEPALDTLKMLSIINFDKFEMDTLYAVNQLEN